MKESIKSELLDKDTDTANKYSPGASHGRWQVGEATKIRLLKAGVIVSAPVALLGLPGASVLAAGAIVSFLMQKFGTPFSNETRKRTDKILGVAGVLALPAMPFMMALDALGTVRDRAKERLPQLVVNLKAAISGGQVDTLAELLASDVHKLLRPGSQEALDLCFACLSKDSPQALSQLAKFGVMDTAAPQCEAWTEFARSLNAPECEAWLQKRPTTKLGF